MSGTTAGAAHTLSAPLERPPARPMLPGGHVVIVTQVSPYSPVGGTSVVLRNLLAPFDPASYTVAFLGRFHPRGAGAEAPPDCYRLVPNWHPVQGLGVLRRGLKESYAVRRAVRLVRRKNASTVVALYPTLASLAVGLETARRSGTRFIPYLHDTVAEGIAHMPVLGQRARSVQAEVFRSAERVLTMSEGMSDYYRAEYGITTHPLQHSYPEPLVGEPRWQRQRTAFWGGSVYAINDRSFERVRAALQLEGIRLEVTSLNRLEVPEADNVERAFYATRAEYIGAVQRHGVLVLALNWPDESAVHPAELSTIFPTKTIEYLATGGPILVHCPEDYFLARFVRRHQCGIIVAERSPEALRAGIAELAEDSPARRRLQRNALAAAEYFTVERVSRQFQSYLQGTI